MDNGVHETDEGAHGRGGVERAEDPALAGPQGAYLMTEQVAGQPGKEETLGKLGKHDWGCPGAGEFVKEWGGAVANATEETVQKKSETCLVDLKTMFLVSSLKAASVEWVGLGLCKKNIRTASLGTALRASDLWNI